MQEFDLQELWGQADDRAEAWYDRLRPDLVATARKKNDSVLQRIRRLVQGELLFSTMAFVWLAFLLERFLSAVPGTYGEYHFVCNDHLLSLLSALHQ